LPVFRQNLVLDWRACKLTRFPSNYKWNND
jgi:hypothetical protein